MDGHNFKKLKTIIPHPLAIKCSAFLKYDSNKRQKILSDTILILLRIRFRIFKNASPKGEGLDF